MPCRSGILWPITGPDKCLGTVAKANVFGLLTSDLYHVHSRYIIDDKTARQMSRSVAQARQNRCLALSRSVLALKMTLWPESGSNLARSGCKFSYG